MKVVASASPSRAATRSLCTSVEDEVAIIALGLRSPAAWTAAANRELGTRPGDVQRVRERVDVLQLAEQAGAVAEGM